MRILFNPIIIFSFIFILFSGCGGCNCTGSKSTTEGATISISGAIDAPTIIGRKDIINRSDILAYDIETGEQAILSSLISDGGTYAASLGSDTASTDEIAQQPLPLPAVQIEAGIVSRSDATSSTFKIQSTETLTATTDKDGVYTINGIKSGQSYIFSFFVLTESDERIGLGSNVSLIISEDDLDVGLTQFSEEDNTVTFQSTTTPNGADDSSALTLNEETLSVKTVAPIPVVQSGASVVVVSSDYSSDGTVTYSLLNNPDFVSLETISNETRLVINSRSTDVIGSYQFTLLASDGEFYSSQIITINVLGTIDTLLESDKDVEFVFDGNFDYSNIAYNHVTNDYYLIVKPTGQKQYDVYSFSAQEPITGTNLSIVESIQSASHMAIDILNSGERVFGFSIDSSIDADGVGIYLSISQDDDEPILSTNADPDFSMTKGNSNMQVVSFENYILIAWQNSNGGQNNPIKFRRAQYDSDAKRIDWIDDFALSLAEDGSPQFPIDLDILPDGTVSILRLTQHGGGPTDAEVTIFNVKDESLDVQAAVQDNKFDLGDIDLFSKGIAYIQGEPYFGDVTNAVDTSQLTNIDYGVLWYESDEQGGFNVLYSQLFFNDSNVAPRQQSASGGVPVGFSFAIRDQDGSSYYNAAMGISDLMLSDSSGNFIWAGAVGDQFPGQNRLEIHASDGSVFNESDQRSVILESNVRGAFRINMTYTPKGSLAVVHLTNTDEAMVQIWNP